jgi:hypothetical protein
MCRETPVIASNRLMPRATPPFSSADLLIASMMSCLFIAEAHNVTSTRALARTVGTRIRIVGAPQTRTQRRLQRLARSSAALRCSSSAVMGFSAGVARSASRCAFSARILDETRPWARSSNSASYLS